MSIIKTGWYKCHRSPWGRTNTEELAKATQKKWHKRKYLFIQYNFTEHLRKSQGLWIKTMLFLCSSDLFKHFRASPSSYWISQYLLINERDRQTDRHLCERETSICCLPYAPQTRNQTHNLLVHRMMLQPTELGSSFYLLIYVTLIAPKIRVLSTKINGRTHA